ncbi:hypothetical protein ACOSQ4_027358 [Xanthoceras sorbifolium]
MPDGAAIGNLDYPLSKIVSHNSADDMCNVIAKNGENNLHSSLHGNLHVPTSLLYKDVPRMATMANQVQLNTAFCDNTLKDSGGLATVVAIGPSKIIPFPDGGLGPTSESKWLLILTNTKIKVGSQLEVPGSALHAEAWGKNENSFTGEIGLGK